MGADQSQLPRADDKQAASGQIPGDWLVVAEDGGASDIVVHQASDERARVLFNCRLISELEASNARLVALGLNLNRLHAAFQLSAAPVSALPWSCVDQLVLTRAHYVASLTKCHLAAVVVARMMCCNAQRVDIDAFKCRRYAVCVLSRLAPPAPLSSLLTCVSSLQHSECVECVAFHPSSRFLATAYGSCAKLWALHPNDTAPTSVATLALEHPVHSVSFDSSGCYLATGSSFDVKLWQLDCGCAAPRFITSINPNPSGLSKAFSFDKLIRNIVCAAFHPSLPYLLACVNHHDQSFPWRKNKSVTQIWSLPSKPLLPNGKVSLFCEIFETEPLRSLFAAFHPTAPYLATCAGRWANVYHLTLSLTQKLNHSLCSCLPHCVEAHAVMSVAFHPSLPRIATAGRDLTAKLWRLRDGYKDPVCVATLQHNSCVLSLAFHESSRYLATATYAASVKLWALDAQGVSAACVANLKHSDGVECVAFLGDCLATCSRDQSAKIW
jgi:WD40 repeat protein